jgi:hypothetical protein
MILMVIWLSCLLFLNQLKACPNHHQKHLQAQEQSHYQLSYSSSTLQLCSRVFLLPSS